MKYGSLFSGAGGFELGLDCLGWKCAWQSEIDIYARQVLSYRWPEVRLYDDIRNIDGTKLEYVDVVVGGVPCQTFSQAGKKTGAGLELFDEFVRIVREMREVSGGEYPRAVLWENVPGLVSKSEWMSHIYSSWAEVGALVQEHRIVDAQFFGVPHRRRRVLGVSIFDPSADCGREILLDPESMSGNTGPSRKTGEDIARESSSGAEGLFGEVVAFNPTQITHPENRDKPDPSKPIAGLSASAKPPHIFFHANQDPIDAPISPSLGVTSQGMGLFDEYGVRRLTPVECERLLGWQDDHTLFRADGLLTSNKQRYKMCGNGIVAPVVTWAGMRLEGVL